MRCTYYASPIVVLLPGYEFSRLVVAGGGGGEVVVGCESSRYLLRVHDATSGGSGCSPSVIRRNCVSMYLSIWQYLLCFSSYCVELGKLLKKQ